MPDLKDGESTEIQGSGAKPYLLKNVGGVYSCSCPAWRNQSVAIERRTCKHLRRLRGDAAEQARIGQGGQGDQGDQGGDGAGPAPAASRPAASGAAKPGAPPVLLAQSFADMAPAIDPAGWWMSEKLDGVRAWWDGSGFLSRLGNRYLAPEWLTAKLPSFPLDGELWLGRRQFQRCVSIARRQDRHESWKELRFVVFDAPAIEAPFEERIARCRAWFERERPSHADVLAHSACRDREHLAAELARVEALGGEGLMLRQPGSPYVAGRSATLLKVKTFLDAEARVIGHTAGSGRHRGRLGALEVEMDGGVRFSIGTGLSDAERASPPAIGAMVTFRYQELSTDGVPRFPSYVGVRDDA